MPSPQIGDMDHEIQLFGVRGVQSIGDFGRHQFDGLDVPQLARQFDLVLVFRAPHSVTGIDCDVDLTPRHVYIYVRNKFITTAHEFAFVVGDDVVGQGIHVHAPLVGHGMRFVVWRLL